MTQDDVRNLVSQAAQSVSAAYWAASDADVRATLMDLENNLNSLLTQLNQDDLESRTDDFNAAAQVMKDSVLPGVKKLDESVERLIQVESAIKTAANDAMKLSSAASFFKIPSLF